MNHQPKSNPELYAHFHEVFPPERLTYRVASDSWDFEGRGASLNDLTKLMAFELESSPQRMQIIITKAATDRRAAATSELLSWLQGVESQRTNDKALRTFLKLMEREGTTSLAHEANVLAMKQFIWQCKRGIMEKPVIWHVVPVYWSRENGTGKSQNIKRILAPMEAFTRNVDVNELGEKFSGKLFARTLVAFLDEFAGVESANAAQLKAIVTGKPIDSRSMYSESGFYAPNRMSCIATSNINPPHGFVDHTGARRFWSIHCSATRMDANPERAAALDATDVDAVWAAISVNDKSPQLTATKELLAFMERERDQHLRTKTSLESFCEECLEESPGERIPIKDFQRIYRDYCHEGKQAMVRGSYASLAARLRELGYQTASTNNRFTIKNVGIVDFTRSHEE